MKSSDKKKAAEKRKKTMAAQIKKFAKPEKHFKGIQHVGFYAK